MGIGIKLAEAFMCGEIKSFATPLEDSQQFLALSESYTDKSASIESAVMELAHGSCHTLTIALSDALGIDTALVIEDSIGMPVHSALHNGELDLILDANGAHKIEDALSFWSSLAGSKCTARTMEIDRIYELCDCDDDQAAMALEDFDLIAEFIQDEIIGKLCEQPTNP